MRRLHEPSPKLNNALSFLAGMMTMVLAFIVVVGVQTSAQGTRHEYNYEAMGNAGAPANVQLAADDQEDLEKWQEGIVEFKGASYRYNADIRTYLIMGIDNDNWVEEAPDDVSGGQSDAMFLLVTDSETQQLTVISINRNTMTEIDVYDETGLSLGKMKAQICLQHAFGDGRKLSCSRSVEAVSKLFGNIPISGYVAMNMGGIPMLNDAVGGVEVKVLQDIKDSEKGVNLRKGTVEKLSGLEAYCYLRKRDVAEFDSASDRLRRGEQYVVAYMDKLRLMAGGNPSMGVGIYRSIADYLVTSVDFTSLIKELMNYDFSEERLYTVPGEVVMGDRYEEYHVDEDLFEDLIYEVFYIKM